MIFCPYCGTEQADSSNFCLKCGKPLNITQNVVSSPVVQTAIPVVTPKVRALGYVGFGLAIGGLFFAALGALYSLTGLAFDDGTLSFIYAIMFGAFSTPCAIVGVRLCQSSMAQGFASKVCPIGSKLSIAGLITTGAMLLLGFIGLLASIA